MSKKSVLVANLKRVSVALGAWALRHETITASVFTLVMGLIIGGAATVIDFFFVT